MGLSQKQFGILLGFKDKYAGNRVSERERGVFPISRQIETICHLLMKSSRKKGAS